jgi:hypothetical protein
LVIDVEYRKTVALHAPWTNFPVAVESLPEVAVETPDAPPVLGRNSECAFCMEPIDEARLAELQALMRSIGFATQTITVRRSIEEFAMVEITFAQIHDPRVPRVPRIDGRL